MKTNNTLSDLVSLSRKVHKYLDSVHVITTDKESTNFRLSMLKEVKRKFDRFADFSKLQMS